MESEKLIKSNYKKISRKNKTAKERFKTYIIRIYKTRSNKKQSNFNLTTEKIIELSYQNCYYCGKPPSNFYRVKEEIVYYSGLDRIDSSKGYTRTNVVSCCKQCNQAKSNLSQKQFSQHISKILKHLNIL